MKKIVIYETESFTIGIRPHMFDWEVGDEIITNGENSEIINIVDETKFNDIKRIINHYNYLQTKIFKAINGAYEMNFLNAFFTEENKTSLKELGFNIKAINIPSSDVIKKELHIQYENTIKNLMNL